MKISQSTITRLSSALILSLCFSLSNSIGAIKVIRNESHNRSVTYLPESVKNVLSSIASSQNTRKPKCTACGGKRKKDDRKNTQARKSLESVPQLAKDVYIFVFVTPDNMQEVLEGLQEQISQDITVIEVSDSMLDSSTDAFFDDSSAIVVNDVSGLDQWDVEEEVTVVIQNDSSDNSDQSSADASSTQDQSSSTDASTDASSNSDSSSSTDDSSGDSSSADQSSSTDSTATSDQQTPTTLSYRFGNLPHVRTLEMMKQVLKGC